MDFRLIAHILGLATAGILLALAGLHVYWAAGGIRAASDAVPTWEGRPLFRPGKASTLLVAVLLIVAAAVLLGRLGILGRFAPGWVFRTGTWALAVVFFARAIGDFKWIGFFKSRTGTRFAALDSALYSPLSLSLAIACALLAAIGPQPDS